MRKLFLVLSVIGIVILGTKCKEDSEDPDIMGCTDSLSLNYNPAANIDDGSCLFEGSITFWYNEATRQELIADGVQSLNFYINGINRASNTRFLYQAGTEDCSDDDNTSFVIPGSENSFAITYSVRDQTGNVIVDGSARIHANKCTLVKLTLL